MKLFKDITLSVDELAGHWTDPAVCLLNNAGIQPISVDLELTTWRTLAEVLRTELGLRRSFRLSSADSLNRLQEQVLHKATRLVAQRVGAPTAFLETAESEESHLRKRTDFLPRMRSQAVGVAL